MTIWAAVLGFLGGLASTWGAQWIALKREDRRWERERDREDVRWKREGEKLKMQHEDENRLNLRKELLNGYVAFDVAARKWSRLASNFCESIASKEVDSRDVLTLERLFEELRESTSKVGLMAPGEISGRMGDTVVACQVFHGNLALLFDSVVEDLGGVSVPDLLLSNYQDTWTKLHEFSFAVQADLAALSGKSPAIGDGAPSAMPAPGTRVEVRPESRPEA